jgi:mitochondrial fission protein ELM1
MTKLEILNALKLNLKSKGIDYSQVVACKSIKIKHPALEASHIDLVISCEKDEYDVFLKVHTNEDLDMFESINDREYTDPVQLTKKINRLIKTENAYWQL